MAKRNWSKYNRELVSRGTLQFLISKEAIRNIQTFRPRSKGGRPKKFPDLLIEILLTVKIHYTLSYRSLEGFSSSVFTSLKKSFQTPSYSTICKRAKDLLTKLPLLRKPTSKVILIDASGIKVYGEGEWKRKIHGRGKARKWLKMHIAINESTQEIVAECLTDSSTADSKMVKPLLEKTPKGVEIVKADGAYDKQHSREAIRNKGAIPLVPPPKNAILHGIDRERDDAICAIRGLGGGIEGRSLWGKLTGYSYRSLVETAFSRFKRLFSGRLFSQTFGRQMVETRLKWILLNKMRNMA